MNTKVGKERDLLCRDCCPLHVGTQARTDTGEGTRRGGIILFGKSGRLKSGNPMLGRGAGDACRRFLRAAQKIPKGARAGARAGELVVGTCNIRTLAFNGANGVT